MSRDRHVPGEGTYLERRQKECEEELAYFSALADYLTEAREQLLRGDITAIIIPILGHGPVTDLQSIALAISIFRSCADDLRRRIDFMYPKAIRLRAKHLI